MFIYIVLVDSAAWSLAMDSSKSLKIFLIHAMVLMIGYTVIRYSLTLFLQQENESTFTSFGIATSALAMQVICSYFWSVILKYIKAPTYNQLVRHGGVMLVAGIMIVAMFHFWMTAIIIGIAVYVAGTSLYTVNLRALTNAHTDDPIARQRFNQRLFLCLNAGAMIGLFGGSALLQLIALWRPDVSYPLLYLTSCAAILAALKLLEAKKHLLYEIPSSDKIILKSWFWFPLALLSMNAIVLFFLLHQNAIRILILTAFIITFAYFFLFRKDMKGKRRYMLMTISGNMVYKIALVTIYVGLTSFLHDPTRCQLLGHSVPPMFFYLFDPIANLLTGVFIILLAREVEFDSRTLMVSGVCILFLAYILLWFAASPKFSFNDTILGKPYINIYTFIFFHSGWGLMFIIACFGAGEYLVAPSVVSEICNMAPNKAAIRNYLGILELSSATGMVFGFYMISLTTKEGPLRHPLTTFQLYTWQLLLLGAVFATMFAFYYHSELRQTKASDNV